MLSKQMYAFSQINVCEFSLQYFPKLAEKDTVKCKL